MNKMKTEELPAVQFYAIGPNQAELAAPLLTAEAADDLRRGEAFGLALAENGGPVCAAACARLLPDSKETLDLISLFVTPEFRRRKLASTLLLELIEGAASATGGELRWITTSYTPDTQGLEEFLGKAGFQITDDESVLTWTLPVSRLTDEPLMTRPAAVPAGYVLRTLEESSDSMLRQLYRALQKNGINDLPLEELSGALPKASHLLFDEEGEPVACAIVTDLGGGRLCLAQFFTANGSAHSAMAVLRAAAKVLIEDYPQGTLEIPTTADSSAKLMRRLAPSGEAVCLRRAILAL